MIPDLHPPSSRRKGIMLCHPFEEKRLARWGSGPYLLQPKLDGERCRAIINPNGSAVLLSSELTLITSVPHITAALEKACLPPGLELDGELYTHGTSFAAIHGAVSRKVNLHADHEQIQYHIFDVVQDVPQWERIVYFKQLKLSPPLHYVPTTVVSDLDEILSHSESYIDDGYEGFILRHMSASYERKRSLWVMKFKPRHSDIYRIVGMWEERDKYGNPKGRLGSLVCACDTHSTEFNVGSGFTAYDRERLWSERESLVGKYIQVKYQSINPSGAPRFPIFSHIFNPLEVPNG